MDLSNDSCDVLLICGGLTAFTKRFNQQTNIDQVNEYIHQEFDLSLPQSYRIVYYNTTTMSFVNLEDQLRNGLNPFELNLSNGVQSTTSTTDCIRLYIVSNTHSHTEIQDDQIVSNIIDNEIRPESNLSTIANTELSQDLSSDIEDRLSTIIPHSIEREKTKNARLRFSLDVKPNQRNIYLSDQFNIRKEKSNGRIARVQGIKTPEEKMLQILPRLRIPLTYLQSNVTLVVAVVSEELNNKMRIWYKYPHKGFLPEGYEKNTKPINPITFNLSKCSLTDHGDYLLNLQMITKWNKSQQEREEYYRCENRIASRLHSAEHVDDTPRLFCVLQRDGVTDWDTFCLSNFIESPKSSKQRSSSMTTGRTCSPTRKRLKQNN